MVTKIALILGADFSRMRPILFGNTVFGKLKVYNVDHLQLLKLREVCVITRRYQQVEEFVWRSPILVSSRYSH